MAPKVPSHCLKFRFDQVVEHGHLSRLAKARGALDDRSFWSAPLTMLPLSGWSRRFLH